MSSEPKRSIFEVGKTHIEAELPENVDLSSWLKACWRMVELVENLHGNDGKAYVEEEYSKAQMHRQAGDILNDADFDEPF